MHAGPWSVRVSEQRSSKTCWCVCKQKCVDVDDNASNVVPVIPEPLFNTIQLDKYCTVLRDCHRPSEMDVSWAAVVVRACLGSARLVPWLTSYGFVYA